jgi:diguanylate cyclase (GGDEF)-like protein
MKTTDFAAGDARGGGNDKRDFLSVALSTISQGVCMFDRARRLIFCNRAYATMYDLPPELTRRGTDFARILDYRDRAGNGPANHETYFDVEVETSIKQAPASQAIALADGRVIKISHHPLDRGGYVAVHEDVTDASRASEQVRFMASHDPLTGLPNRNLLREKLDRLLPLSKEGASLALLYLDLDRFKGVNDSLGHPVGDALLKAATGRLCRCLRDDDFIARVGGDEFVILQADVQDVQQVALLAERLCSAIGQPFNISGHDIHIGASIGITMAPPDCNEADILVENADTALYEAKANGRGSFCFFDRGMDETLIEQRQLEADLGKALGAGQFEIYYQPEIDSLTGLVTTFEALLRWHHPERGLLLPEAFIPLAEKTGLILPIGAWCLRQACVDAAAWPASVRVAVNLSAVQCRSDALARTVVSALAKSGLAPTRLELEITEATLLSDDEAALMMLHHLKSLGVRIVMDDFGTGYSSLSYLRLFPFDKIKIAQQFIAEAEAAGDYDAIVRAVVGVGLNRGFTTTVEGVETSKQFRSAVDQGCTEIQGFFFGKPMPVHDAEKLCSTISVRAARTLEYAQRVLQYKIEG